MACRSYRTNTATDMTTVHTLPPTAELLLEGGDARIAPGADGISNKYGCRPFPDPELLSFGSSTASVISETAFAAAERLRDRLLPLLGTASRAAVYASELQRVRNELKTLCGLADMPGLDIVFAASGTDLHLIASQIAGGTASHPTRIILVGAEETGSSVPAALAGKHFSTRSSLGHVVAEGSPVAGDKSVELATVPIRLPDGSARDIADIDADVESLALEATALKRRVLLILVDVSKTGLIAPSPACAAALQQRLAGSIDVLVDACQFRIAPMTLRAYLEAGFMVALTGSKFAGGPTFSGALFLPFSIAERLRTQTLPSALSAYSARAEWPATWKNADIFGEFANFGLLLRWEAALEELRSFHAVRDTVVADFLRAFGNAMHARLQDSAHFEPLITPQLDRGAFGDPAGWDRCQTIFPFLLRGPATGGGTTPLNREQTAEIYRLLQIDLGDGLRCQLGQPVTCGTRDGIPVSALRMCASARLVVAGTAQEGKHAAGVIASAMQALDKAASCIAKL